MAERPKVSYDAAVLTLAIGAYFLGAVYLGVAGSAAIATGNRFAIVMVLGSAGLGYICQIASLLLPNAPVISTISWVASVAAAVVAGALIVGG